MRGRAPALSAHLVVEILQAPLGHKIALELPSIVSIMQSQLSGSATYFANFMLALQTRQAQGLGV